MRPLNLLIAGPAAFTFGLLVAVALIAAPASSSAFASPTAAGSTCTVTADGRSGGGSAAGVQLSAEQMHNAQVIVAVVQARDLPQVAAQIAVMTAMQESGLRVLDHGDLVGPDSRGLFQQRRSWGPLSVRMEPAGSTGLFLDRLIAVPSWQTMAPQLAAHAVQRNQNANDYTKWIGFSQALVGALTGQDPVQVQCAGGTLSPGAAPSAKTQVALAAARSMLGRPYCWDGGDVRGPTHGDGGSGCGPGVVGFDCSGLVLYAWARAGIYLSHLASADTTVGRQVPLAKAQPGDLVFLADAGDGIHHVAMIWSITPGTATGAGQIIEAQDFHVPVHIRPWRGTAEPEVLPYAVRLAG